MGRILKWAAIGIVLFLVAVYVIDIFLGPEDSCLDSGGCWDAVDNVCRKSEPNAQELCDRSKPR